MRRQTAKKNLDAQEPWVDFYTHKCDKDPLHTTSLMSVRSGASTIVVLDSFVQKENGWYFTV